MLTTRYAQVSAMHTMSNEVVTRLATEHEEDSQSAYHVAKRDYQLTMNRISPRLTSPKPPSHLRSMDMNELETYCSSPSLSLNSTLRRSPAEEDLSTTIDRELFARAMRRRNEDVDKNPSWKRDLLRPSDKLLQREAWARCDVEELQHEYRAKMTAEFGKNPLLRLVALMLAERRARRVIEDDWMTASLPFLHALRGEQTDFIEAFWRRTLGRKGTDPRGAWHPPSDAPIPLDVRFYCPLQHRCDVIRSETEAEEDIAFRYLQIGQASQRDLVMDGIMRRNKDNGLLDSTKHPIYYGHYDAVDFAFHTEFRYMESNEETERMAIIDSAIAEWYKMQAEMMAGLNTRRQSKK